MRSQMACADTGASCSAWRILICSWWLPISTQSLGRPWILLGGCLPRLHGEQPKHRYQPYPFLSREACLDPSIGSCNNKVNSLFTAPQCSNSGVQNTEEKPSSSPVRPLPPSTTPTLPCDPIPANLPILKKYVLDRYAANARNTCEHQPLPLNEGRPPYEAVHGQDCQTSSC